MARLAVIWWLCFARYQLCTSTATHPYSQPYYAIPIKYGKYYFFNRGKKDFSDNTYHLFKPEGVEKTTKLPVIFQIYGHGWGSPSLAFTTPNSATDLYVLDGMAFVSTAYRVIDRHYYFDDEQRRLAGPLRKDDTHNYYLDDESGSRRLSGLVSRTERKSEELIHIKTNGELVLDTNGKIIDDYEIQISFYELITKPIFDVVQSLNHLIDHAEESNLDPHRIVFIGSSAGAAEVNYLTWVYHQWHVKRFTPVAIILTNPQFNLPVMPTLEYVWKDFAEHLEEGTRMSDLTTWDFCPIVTACDRMWKKYCNWTWTNEVGYKVCASKKTFHDHTVEHMTRSELFQWDETLPEYGAGLKKLWLTSENMLHHQPKNIKLLVHTAKLKYSPTEFLHHSMFVQQYAEYADRAGVDYTVFYANYPRMKAPATLASAKESADVVYGGKASYVSSIDWYKAYKPIQMLDVEKFPPELHVMFACLALGLDHCSPTQGVQNVISWLEGLSKEWNASAKVHWIQKQVPLLSIAMVGCVVLIGLIGVSVRRKSLRSVPAAPYHTISATPCDNSQEQVSSTLLLGGA